MTKGKILAIDYGDKRVGVAISDYNKEIAFPRDFLENNNQVIDHLRDIIEEEEVIKVILGLPLEMSGQQGESALKAMEFGRKLMRQVTVPVEFFDERLTTKQASDKLSAMGVKQKEQKQGIDSASAQVMLEAYLNSL